MAAVQRQHGKQVEQEQEQVEGRGQAAGALWEGLKRQIARLRGRPTPGYVDVAKLLPVTYVVSIALISMSVLLMYADVVNPIKLGG